MGEQKSQPPSVSYFTHRVSYTLFRLENCIIFVFCAMYCLKEYLCYS